MDGILANFFIWTMIANILEHMVMNVKLFYHMGRFKRGISQQDYQQNLAMNFLYSKKLILLIQSERKMCIRLED